jgi:hypothetical protein
LPGYGQGYPGYGGYRGQQGYGWNGGGFQLPPPPRRRRRWPAVVATGTVLAVVAAAVIVMWPDSGPPHPDEWDARVADLATFVEGERGLAFEHPVYVDFLSDAAYSDTVRIDDADLTDDQRADADSLVSMLRALGLASGDLDLVEATNDLADDGTLAFYDPTTERITVRGTELTTDLKVTLVHEMTHALQDQHFDLDALQEEIYADVDFEAAEGDPADDPDGSADLAQSNADSAFSGYQALVEGDAVRIENGYIATLSDDELGEYQASFQEDLDQADTDLGGVPAALRAFQATPYVLGQPLVDLVAADGGNAAVDAMFDDHPRTEEHLLDPPTYVARDGASDLPLPEPPAGSDADVVDRGTMGAVELYVVLAERIDPLVALDAADGWGNATFVSYTTDDRTCVRVLADGDTPEDDQQLRSALTAWVDAAPAEANAAVGAVGSEQTQIDSCDPGTGGAAGNDRGLDALTVPAVRSQMTYFAADGGAPLDAAWQSGDCFVHHLTFDQMVQINETTEPTLPANLQTLVDDAFAACPVS